MGNTAFWNEITPHHLATSYGEAGLNMKYLELVESPEHSCWPPPNMRTHNMKMVAAYLGVESVTESQRSTGSNMSKNDNISPLP